MSDAIAVDETIKTYRGDSIESLLPQIRAELGSDAVIVSRREGLIGGVGGFFQKRCVEVDARAGGARVDVYDEEPSFDEESAGARGLSGEGETPAGEDVASFSESPPPLPPAPGAAFVDEEHVVRNDAATREGLATPAVQELVDQAQPFAEMLREMDEGPAHAEMSVGPPRAKALREGLVAAGLGDDIARDVIEAVVVSQMPFANSGRLRTLVRNEMALRMPVAPAVGPGERTLVFVGPAGSGKTTAMEAIATAHEAAGMNVTRREIGDPGPHPGGLLLVDTPPLWGGADELTKVAAAIARLDDPEVHLVMRAGTAAGAGKELVEGLSALRPNRLLLTGAGETAHLGGVVDVAIRSGLPLGYVAEGADRIAPADPRDLAGRIVP